MFTSIDLPKSDGRIRPLHLSDLKQLVQKADDPGIGRYMMNTFPSPYTEKDGEQWLQHIAKRPVLEGLAIEIQGEFAGTIACRMQTDVHFFTGVLGYWLAQPLWGKGIMSEAVTAFADHLLTQQNVMRLEAHVYEINAPSARVLEKCGFVMEGRKRKAVYKHGRFMDELVYARVRNPR